MKSYAEGLQQRVVDDIDVVVVATHKLVVVVAVDEYRQHVVVAASIFELHKLHAVALVENSVAVVAIVAFQLKKKSICNKIKKSYNHYDDFTFFV